MKKRVRVLFVCLVFGLVLTSCGEEKLAINHSTEAPVSASSSAVVNGESDLMLIQTNSPSFPQSQGVYDYHDHALTIVKQYLPMAEIEEEDAADPQAATDYEKQIRADFDRHFSHTAEKMTDDPYQIYEADFDKASYTIENDRLILSTKTQTFTFIFDPESKQAIDDNGVRYDIQVDE
ncbi:hypothetical protein A5886_001691 [Enterococcus sp. 8G7_MSG3316]|uniref:Lipoprotein n=1 Tax=Candidatus Enterococcus testudinis TaxID=1834191 RepID=A0A242A7M4_9ENTE|nr:hypothetical protein [Enterococcus sp. 8G7_MSG3316]OTN76613.1 hypothetical protein A5886_001691 [Enterococcus sp. 8G7_MSG3316]